MDAAIARMRKLGSSSELIFGENTQEISILMQK
jgi:hypothetical protein